MYLMSFNGKVLKSAHLNEDLYDFIYNSLTKIDLIDYVNDRIGVVFIPFLGLVPAGELIKSYLADEDNSAVWEKVHIACADSLYLKVKEDIKKENYSKFAGWDIFKI